MYVIMPYLFLVWNYGLMDHVNKVVKVTQHCRFFITFIFSFFKQLSHFGSIGEVL